MPNYTSANTVVELLSAATGVTTGAGLMVRTSTLPEMMSFQTVITGAPTGVTVTLEGSLDGTNFFLMDTTTLATGEIRFISYKPVMYVRAKLTVLTGGTAPTVTVLFLAVN